MENNLDLLAEIEIKRAEMTRSVSVNGISHPKTVAISQSLDKLINQSMIGGIENVYHTGN